MEEPTEVLRTLVAVVTGIGVLGIIFHMVWRVERADALWEKIRQARGWEAPEETFFGMSWKLNVREGPIQVRAGYSEPTRGRGPMTLFELEFDAPFPEDLEIESRTLKEGVAVDERLGDAQSEFARHFEVHTRGRQPVTSPVMQPRFVELLLEVLEPGGYLRLDKRRLRVGHARALLDHEEVAGLIDRYLRISQEIAQMAGLEQVESDDSGDGAFEKSEAEREREEARSPGAW